MWGFFSVKLEYYAFLKVVERGKGTREEHFM